VTSLGGRVRLLVYEALIWGLWDGDVNLAGLACILSHRDEDSAGYCHRSSLSSSPNTTSIPHYTTSLGFQHNTAYYHGCSTTIKYHDFHLPRKDLEWRPKTYASHGAICIAGALPNQVLVVCIRFLLFCFVVYCMEMALGWIILLLFFVFVFGVIDRA